jgi:hypothetical protein
MADEGHFAEGIGAILDPLKYQVLWDWLAQHNTPGITVVPVEAASPEEMLASRQVQRAFALSRGETVEPDPNDPYTWSFRRVEAGRDD